MPRVNARIAVDAADFPRKGKRRPGLLAAVNDELSKLALDVEPFNLAGSQSKMKFNADQCASLWELAAQLFAYLDNPKPGFRPWEQAVRATVAKIAEYK
jgi:hypothetical protein